MALHGENVCVCERNDDDRKYSDTTDIVVAGAMVQNNSSHPSQLYHELFPYIYIYISLSGLYFVIMLWHAGSHYIILAFCRLRAEWYEVERE